MFKLLCAVVYLVSRFYECLIWKLIPADLAAVYHLWSNAGQAKRHSEGVHTYVLRRLVGGGWELDEDTPIVLAVTAGRPQSPSEAPKAPEARPQQWVRGPPGRENPGPGQWALGAGGPWEQLAGPSGPESRDPDTRLSPEGDTQRRGCRQCLSPCSCLCFTHTHTHTDSHACDSRQAPFWREQLRLFGQKSPSKRERGIKGKKVVPPGKIVPYDCCLPCWNFTVKTDFDTDVLFDWRHHTFSVPFCSVYCVWTKCKQTHSLLVSWN